MPGRLAPEAHRAKDWPPEQTAAEGPYAPGEQVGIQANTKSGPCLYVMFDGVRRTVRFR